MTRNGTGRLLAWSLGIALMSGLIVVAGLVQLGRSPLAGLAGWSLTAGIGVPGGLWMARRHGCSDAGFLVALGTCMLARLFGAALGVGLFYWLRPEALLPFIVGLVAGYLPLQVFESIWFARRQQDGATLTRRTDPPRFHEVTHDVG